MVAWFRQSAHSVRVSTTMTWLAPAFYKAQFHRELGREPGAESGGGEPVDALLAQEPRRSALDLLHKAMDPILGIDLHQQMAMIRHDLHLDDLRGTLGGHLVNDGLQPFIHARHQDPPSIFWAPDPMIFAENTTLWLDL